MWIFYAREQINRLGGEMMARITVKSIKKSLQKQLEDMGADLDHFESLVDDYCFMWEQCEVMKQNIRERGLVYPSVSSAGAAFERENPCTKNVLQYNKQMLAILKELHLSTDNIIAEDDDEL